MGINGNKSTYNLKYYNEYVNNIIIIS